MASQLTELERLNIGARARTAETALSYVRIIMIPVSLFLVVLAVNSEASARETLAVRVMAVVASVSCIAMWLKWRYAMHLWAILFALFGIGEFLIPQHSPTVVGRIAMVLLAVSFLGQAFLFWKRNRYFAITNTKDWEPEKSRVRKWCETLINEERPFEVIEFSAGSFWTGYFTYRLLREERYCVSGTFKKGSKRLVDLKVVNQADVRIVDRPNGEMDLFVGDLKIKRVNASPILRNGLASLLAN